MSDTDDELEDDMEAYYAELESEQQ